MKNKLAFFGLLMIAFSALLTTETSCYYDNEVDLYGSTACDTATVRYSVEVAKILKDANCYVCHSNAAANGGVTIEGYANLKESVDNGTLIGSVRWLSGFSQMPKNAAQLTECDLQKVEKWIADGAPNN